MPPPRENFLKNGCNLVCFGVYLDQILSINFFKNYHFYIKLKKNYVRNILIIVVRICWGVQGHMQAALRQF